MNIQESKEFQTSKFYCKTNFDMAEIKREEDDYKNFPLHKPYIFDSKEEKERILYANYNKIDEEVKSMIKEITSFKKKE